MNSKPQRPKLYLISIICGVLLTSVLTGFAFAVNSRAWVCTFAWQACLVQTVIHTPDNPIHEASPIDLFAFVFGILLGVPIYSLLSYVLLLHWQKSSSDAGGRIGRGTERDIHE
jgi:hypothetical protein